ncbi:MAG: Flp pilus assembly complex ATPase component TadA, partial [Pararhodobacter sp.]|nr:Flp pilus assembly complex ATPase component TadA [Pararhodobacter sp.]
MPDPRLPFVFARDNQVALEGARLLIGPEATMNGLREARRVAGRPLTPDALDTDAFQSALARLYDATGDADSGPEVAFDLEDGARAGSTRDLLEDPEDAPVIKLVNQLLRQAVRAQASDLHLEPHEDGLRARTRVDGTMQTVFDRRDVPARRVVSRLKVMSGLDIAETRLPQDGRIALRLGGRAIDVRLSTLPGHHGERVVMRLLDRSAGLMALDRLGLSDADAARLNRLASLPNGIILA